MIACLLIPLEGPVTGPALVHRRRLVSWVPLVLKGVISVHSSGAFAFIFFNVKHMIEN